MTDLEWWRRGATYQIYPRSFADSDGDGVGDLEGIRAHLGHVASTGAQAIWLSPIFPSPMADFGYDVSDYCDVDPVFGSLESFERLVADAHARGLRVVLDWVANHTSDQHPWFVSSRAGKDSPHRDWYVWADPAPDGGPPNNWVSAFEAVGPAWTYDEASGQYYLHSFAPQQPDLNWDNPAVEAAMHDVARFWFDRGVDGLRLDAIVKIGKDPALGDLVAGEATPHEDWPTIDDRLRRLRSVVDEYDDRVVVGELCVFDLPRFVEFLDGTGMHLAHNFELVDGPWEAGAWRDFLTRWDALAPDAWPCWVLENHDVSRVATRYDGGTGLGPARARAALVLLHTLRGTPFLYQGQELGLPDAVVPPERVVDVAGRDPARAPVPWSRPSRVGRGAGFTTGEPWLPLVDDAEGLSVEAQEEDLASTLALTRAVARLRAGSVALQRGAQRLLDVGEDVLAVERTAGDESSVVLVSFGTTDVAVPLPTDRATGARLVLTSYPGVVPGEGEWTGTLRAGEAVVLSGGGG